MSMRERFHAITPTYVVGKIGEAFSGRRMPRRDRIIDSKVAGRDNLEAEVVEEFFSAPGLVSIGASRAAPVLDADIYLSLEGMRAVLPMLLSSVVENFREDDMLLRKIYYVLGKCDLSPSYSLAETSTQQERHAVCLFARWVLANAHDEDLHREFAEVVQIWCARAPSVAEL